MTAAAEATARQILADIEAGIPQPRPIDWPDIDAITAAANQAEHNNHCHHCRSTP